MATSASRGSNVSVTSINCGEMDLSMAGAGNQQASTDPAASGPSSGKSHFFNAVSGGGSIRISVPKIEESDDELDPELSSIEKTSKVNMRPTKASDTDSTPRPMSWEGELSGNEEDGSLLERINPVENNEDSNMEVDCGNSKNSLKPDVFSEPPAIKKEKSDNNNTISIKPEFYEKNLLVKSSSSALNPAPSKFEVVNLKYEHENGILPINSPLLVRSKSNLLPANPSPDSAIHSVYTHSSPSQSPLTSRHAIYTPSLSRNNSDASHSSCYSYSSEFSPTHSPIQGRHHTSLIYSQGNHHHPLLFRPSLLDPGGGNSNGELGDAGGLMENDQLTTTAAGISRQQLINSPCPICGDKISGFHYGIFSCESCKGFFKRTVQNRKNYVCVRGAACPVTIATRKKCPACRFEKCLQRGMKLEAIREDRTRGGRSTYQCSFTLPGSMLSPESTSSTSSSSYYHNYRQNGGQPAAQTSIKKEDQHSLGGNSSCGPMIPQLLQEIMDVEHLWQMNESEMSRLNQPSSSSSSSSPGASLAVNPLLISAGIAENGTTSPDVIANLCNIADHRLYKIVKWCKSLPLFKNISIDDQICLLINSWCELLLFSCCYRSVTSSPGSLSLSLGKSITLAQAKSSGLQTCIERMLNLTDHLRRLRVDRYEYVAMKVIVLLQSDTSELKEPEKVRTSQEKALQALQSYTLAHYPESPAKFGELLLRIPELQRTCQVGKEMLTIRSKEGEEFNLLMELLRGEH